MSLQNRLLYVFDQTPQFGLQSLLMWDLDLLDISFPTSVLVLVTSPETDISISC